MCVEKEEEEEEEVIYEVCPSSVIQSTMFGRRRESWVQEPGVQFTEHGTRQREML